MAKFKKLKYTFFLDAETLRDIHPHERIRQKIIDALESGNYRQSTGRMCDPKRKNTACCLHVAAIAADDAKWEDGIDDNNGGFSVGSFGTPTGMYGDLTTHQVGKKISYRMEHASVRCHVRDFNGEVMKSSTSFVCLNDEFELSFKKIAAILRGEAVNIYRNEPVS